MLGAVERLAGVANVMGDDAGGAEKAFGIFRGGKLLQLSKDLPHSKWNGAVSQRAFAFGGTGRCFVEIHPGGPLQAAFVLGEKIEKGLAIFTGQIHVGKMVPVFLSTSDRALHTIDVGFPHDVRNIREWNKISRLQVSGSEKLFIIAEADVVQIVEQELAQCFVGCLEACLLGDLEVAHGAPVLRVLSTEITDDVQTKFAADNGDGTGQTELEIAFILRTITKTLATPFQSNRTKGSAGFFRIKAPESAGIPGHGHERSLGFRCFRCLTFGAAVLFVTFAVGAAADQEF